MRLHEDAFMRAGNAFDLGIGRQFSPTEVILKGGDQGMTASSEQGYRTGVRLGDVTRQETEVIFP